MVEVSEPLGLLKLCQWLEQTRLSGAIRESAWGFSIIESVHVLALGLLGMTALIDLRVLRLTLNNIPVSEVSAQLTPWAAAGLVTILVSGVLMFLNAPVDYYGDSVFRIKLILLVLAAVNAWLLRIGVWRRAPVACAVSLVLWVGLLITGRFISYHLLGSS
jgi:hypothetical protein